MDHFPKFQMQAMDAVKLGAFYGFNNGGKLHLGFAVMHPTIRAQTFVSMSPGSPACGNRPGLIHADDFAAKSLIAFEDARIRLPFDAGSARTGKKTEDIAGAIVLIDGALGIAALLHPTEAGFSTWRTEP
jgi:hypothetical protein